MNSLRKSIGRIFLVPVGLAFHWAFMVSCSSRPPKDSTNVTAQVQENLAPEISLGADRREFDKLRQEIPKDRQQENDELALILPLLNEAKTPPGDLQMKFQGLVQKRREAFQKKVRRLREVFHQEEIRRREDFLKTEKQAREKFMVKKANRQQSKGFFADQDLKRRDFFSQESERRKEFEAEVSAQTKDFDSNLREKIREFGEQLQMYSKRYYDQR